MSPGLLCEEDFADAYARWADGDCPCCGVMRMESYWPDNYGEPHAPQVIGEGVMICGRCVANEHGREFDEFFPMMLRAIVDGAAKGRRG